MTAETVPVSSQSDGRWRIAFVPTADSPLSVADLDAGDLLTYSFTDGGFDLQTSQAEVPDKRLTLTADLARPGRKKPTLNVKYVDSVTAGSAKVVLTEGVEGFIVVRRGIDNATAWTIGQKVDVITVVAGAQRPDAPVENGVDTFSQQLFITDVIDEAATLVA